MKPSYEELEEKVDMLSRLLKEALEKITKLEEQLKLNSKNSSKPPSSDQKGNSPDKPKKQRPPKKGESRAPFSAERVDSRVECERTSCAHCGADALELLTGLAEILQQVELPAVRALVTEYILHKYNCATCGKLSTAELPEGVANTVFGPSVMALFATLTGVFHLAKREAIQLIQELYGIDISLGSASNIEERISNALDPVCIRIHRVIMEGPFSKHFDETSWRNSGKRRYVWVASCEKAAYYRIDPSRSRAAFEKLTGVATEDLSKVVTDRYGVYSKIIHFHQYCLAHLIRDFKRFEEGKDPDKPIGKALAKELAKACKTHGEYREGNITKKQRNMRLGHSKRRVQFWLDDGYANGGDKLSSLCDRLLINFEKLWTFTTIDGMEPTNNLAERDLRKLVIWRKKSFGTRSSRGEKFVARITTVSETVKRHGLSILRYLEEVIRAVNRGGTPPLICASLGL